MHPAHSQTEIESLLNEKTAIRTADNKETSERSIGNQCFIYLASGFDGFDNANHSQKRIGARYRSAFIARPYGNNISGQISVTATRPGGEKKKKIIITRVKLVTGRIQKDHHR